MILVEGEVFHEVVSVVEATCKLVGMLYDCVKSKIITAMSIPTGSNEQEGFVSS